MLRYTAHRRRRQRVDDVDKPPELTCDEPPFRRAQPQANRFSVATRAQVLTLREYTSLTIDAIVEITGVKKSEVSNILKRARDRGYSKGQPLQQAFFEDAARIGRPVTATTTKVAAEVIKIITKSRNSRTLTSDDLARQLQRELAVRCSAQSVWRVLRTHGYSKVKPTRKPGLTAAQKKARLEWCLQHKDWTLDDWKQVLWSDETSVVSGVRRGGERVWRTVYERNAKSCSRGRWKGFLEFMFWGCYSYDHKGPCFVWEKESKTAKAKADKDLQQRNAKREEDCRVDWELATATRRKLRLRSKAKGPSPQWKWSKATGKLVREGKAGGIDWYRYGEEVLKPLVFPFAKQYGLTVQEDGAAAHVHSENVRLYSLFNIQRLLWPGNSPDLNQIEPCWGWMKKRAAAHPDFDKKGSLQKIFKQIWAELEQSRIQRWIQRIIRHIREVIRLEGGNEYREGSEEKEIDRLALTFDTLSIN